METSSSASATKGILVLGLAALGCLLFYPAAETRIYVLFLLFVVAGGITILQVAANPYISVLVPETASVAQPGTGVQFIGYDHSAHCCGQLARRSNLFPTDEQLR